MSEWWPLILVFWALFLADGLVFGKRRHHFVHGGLLPRRPLWTFGPVQWLAPWPWTWRLHADDAALSLSPLGVGNLPAGCAGRPAEETPVLRALRWEDIRSISGDSRRIRVNGEDFCPATGLFGAADLGRLRTKLAPLDEPGREAVLRAELKLWFQHAGERRRHRAWLARTRGLSVLNTLVLLLLLALSAYAAADPTLWLPEPWVFHINARLPLFLGLLGGAHLLALVFACLLRRRSPSAAAAPGFAQWLGVLLMPAQALRLRHFLAGDWCVRRHPLAVALALGQKATVLALARNTLGDLLWPLQSRTPAPPLALSIRDWHAKVLVSCARTALQDRGIDPDALFTTPRPHSNKACGWCPRCGDQFDQPEARCPRGVAPVPFSRPAGETAPHEPPR